MDACQRKTVSPSSSVWLRCDVNRERKVSSIQKTCVSERTGRVGRFRILCIGSAVSPTSAGYRGSRSIIRAAAPKEPARFPNFARVIVTSVRICLNAPLRTARSAGSR